MSPYFAPVVVFAYKRHEELMACIGSLEKCKGASQTPLYIFSDGARGEKDQVGVAKVREFIQTVKGFESVSYFFSPQNNGLGKSIIQGVNQVLESYPSVIVLEDDLVPSRNFLQFMNQGLGIYETNKKIFSITGYNYPFRIKNNEPYDTYFLPRPCSTGWGTWKDRWTAIDWEVKDFAEFKKNREAVRDFNKAGSDIFNMLDRQQRGVIDSWAVRWAYNQWKTGSLTAYATVSKIKNIGFSGDSSNTNIYNKYASKLDPGDKNNFQFPEHVGLDPFYHRQLLGFFSLKTRIKNRILTYLCRLGLIKNKS